MHAMSHRSEFFLPSSFKVNIEEPAFNLTIMYLLPVTQVELPRVQFPTWLSDTKSLKSVLQEIMISTKNECVVICDMSELTLQIIFTTWWA